VVIGCNSVFIVGLITTMVAPMISWVISQETLPMKLNIQNTRWDLDGVYYYIIY